VEVVDSFHFDSDLFQAAFQHACRKGCVDIAQWLYDKQTQQNIKMDIHDIQLFRIAFEREDHLDIR
jgi:hypothetical protein